MVINSHLAELTGAIMGDGNIWTNNRSYEIVITGDVVKDRDYFFYLTEMLYEFDTIPRIRIRGSLRLIVRSKRFFELITQELRIPWGANKAESGAPKEILNNRTAMCCFIRGVFDTDGTIFISKKPGESQYPSLEITNANRLLVEEITAFLEKEGYSPRVRFFRGIYKIALYGRYKIKKWYSQIGSSNNTKLAKFTYILNK